MFSQGQVAYSKCGRDKGRPFVIISVENGYVYLADGRIHKLEKPKKKKCKHIQITNDISLPLKKKLEEHLAVLDSELRRALLPYTDGEDRSTSMC